MNLKRRYWCCPDCGHMFFQSYDSVSPSHHICKENNNLNVMVIDPWKKIYDLQDEIEGILETEELNL